jgi:hydroxymethylglutaryl-CoA lyase
MTDYETNFNNPSAWRIPREVELSDITVRDGFQSLETIISTEDKVSFLEGLIKAGFKRVEVSNYSHPKLVPFFNDVDEVFKRLINSDKVGHFLKQNKTPEEIAKGDFVELTAVTITRKAFERAMDSYQKGYGPDRVLQMVSTDPRHHKRNSGSELEDYWVMCAQSIKDAHSLGILYNGTVSTIWGSPYKEFVPTLEKAIEFVKRFLDIDADDIEHADHDGSLTNPADAYKYFSMVLNPEIMGRGPDGRDYSNPKLHIAHFHTKNMISGLSNVIGALRAGIVRFESTMSGIGGEPANKVDGVLIPGREEYYTSHFNHGLVSSEDIVALMHGMGISTGIDTNLLISLAASLQLRLEKFNETQKNAGQETMPCRSFMVTKGALPEAVLKLAKRL